ncbi:MAG: hypothetical protein ACPF9I_03075 [Candidatus Thalassarchaeaceae archaeon]
MSKDPIRFRMSPPAGGKAESAMTDQVIKMVIRPDINNNLPLRGTSLHRLIQGTNPVSPNFHLNHPRYSKNRPKIPRTPSEKERSSQGPDGAQPMNRTSMVMIEPMLMGAAHAGTVRPIGSGSSLTR